MPAHLRPLFLLFVLCGAPPIAAQPSGGRAVLVTGASSGIGRKVTELLASRGYFVYATARKPEDLAALDRIPNVKAIRLDVTKADEIAAAVETVRREGRGLYGLVNNAGGAVVGPLIEHDESEMIWQFDVNVYGPWRLVKAFAPMLIESKGTTTGRAMERVAQKAFEELVDLNRGYKFPIPRDSLVSLLEAALRQP
jgi:NAD(P)-dependent dehydrogenase (short-subunit alcohol dehydrogenase family)